MFNKRHYVALAAKTKELLSGSDHTQPADPMGMIAMLVELLESDNTNFQPQRFVEACGIRWEDYLMYAKQ